MGDKSIKGRSPILNVIDKRPEEEFEEESSPMIEE